MRKASHVTTIPSEGSRPRLKRSNPQRHYSDPGFGSAYICVLGLLGCGWLQETQLKLAQKVMRQISPMPRGTYRELHTIISKQSVSTYKPLKKDPFNIHAMTFIKTRPCLFMFLQNPHRHSPQSQFFQLNSLKDQEGKLHLKLKVSKRIHSTSAP